MNCFQAYFALLNDIKLNSFFIYQRVSIRCNVKRYIMSASLGVRPSLPSTSPFLIPFEVM